MVLCTPTQLYLQRLASSGRQPMRSQLNQVRKILKWQGNVESQPYHLLEYADIEQVKHIMSEQGKAARTVNLALNGLKCIVKEGFLMALTPEKTWLKVQAIKLLKTTPSNRGMALTSIDVQSLLLDCVIDQRPIGIRDTAILAVFLSSGLRRFELSNLTYDDLDQQSHSLKVRAGKGNKSRTQFLPDWTLPHIEAWLRFRGNEQGFLFNPFRSKVPNTAHQLSASTIYRIVKSRTAVALEKSTSPHDLRRSFITQLLRQNVDLSTTSKLAGHASLATTQIYDKRGEEFARDAALSLSFN